MYLLHLYIIGILDMTGTPYNLISARIRPISAE